MARWMYLRLQSGWLRAAAWAASTSKKRNKELPCLLICPSRCLPPLQVFKSRRLRIRGLTRALQLLRVPQSGNVRRAIFAAQSVGPTRHSSPTIREHSVARLPLCVAARQRHRLGIRRRRSRMGNDRGSRLRCMALFMASFMAMSGSYGFSTEQYDIPVAQIGTSRGIRSARVFGLIGRNARRV